MIYGGAGIVSGIIRRQCLSQVLVFGVAMTRKKVGIYSQNISCRLSSMAIPKNIHQNDDDDRHSDKDGTNDLISSNKHCPTCCCGQNSESQSNQPLPPPLPEPTYSVHKRVLPSHLIALSSSRGRQMLMETLSASQDWDSPYWSLSEHFQNQSDPAFCGITTLIMVLNSMSIDPQIRWKGGWRYFGSEDVLLTKCCISAERIRRVGITMDEYKQLAHCQGVRVIMKRPNCIDEFRNDLRIACLTSRGDSSATKLVCSFSRAALGQTGDGHFSPVGAYHAESDSALVMDVARFKYPPYWVSVDDLYRAMCPIDEATQKSRGWFLLSDPPRHRVSISNENYHHNIHELEHRRPAKLVPLVGQSDICPIGKIKVQFCKVASEANYGRDPRKES